MRKLFDTFGDDQALRNSVKINLLFFRSRSMKEWETISLEMRRLLEQYSSEKVFEIIRTLQPRIILVEGLQTYHRLLGPNVRRENETILKSGTRIVAVTCEVDFDESRTVMVVGILHPSGARVSRLDGKIISDMLASALKKL